MSNNELSKTQKMVLDNGYQGNALRVLCVCTVGMLRSPTLANILNQHSGKYNARSAGIDELALIEVTEKLLYWTDWIIVMDYSTAQSIHDMGFDGVIYNFSVSDDYSYNDSVLIDIFNSRLENIEQYRW